MINRIPSGQSWIVELMKGRIHVIAGNAACEGIISTLAMLILTSPQSCTKAITSINNLLKFMSMHQAKELKEQIEQVYLKQKTLLLEEKRKVLLELAGKDLPQEELATFYNELSEAEKKEVMQKVRDTIKNLLSKEDNDYLKIDSILQAIAVFFTPYDFPYLFSEKNKFTYVQDLTLSAPILLSDVKKVDIVLSRPACFLSKSELASSFNALQESIHKNNYNQPLILFFRSSTHTGAIGYSKKDAIWFVIDSSDLPIGKFSAKPSKADVSATDKIAHNLYCLFGLRNDGPIVLSTCIYSISESQKFSLELIVKSWMRSPIMKSIFTNDVDRIKIIDEKNDNLLMLAVVTNQPEMVTDILTDTNVDPNRPGRKNIFPLIYSTRKNFVEVVKALLSHPLINPNQLYENSYNALHVAILGGNYEIAKMLIEHNAIDLTIKNKAGFTPFDLIKNTDQIDLITLMENKLNKQMLETKPSSTPDV